MLLLGEPGIGKSRLVREVTARAGTQARVLVGRCPAYGDGVTYWPLREIVLQAQRGRPLAALLEPTDEGRAAAAVIAATLGLGGHAPAEAAPWAFRLLLEALARDRPLLLALDDAHWAEPPLLDLVDELVRVAAPVLVLCVGRPELLSARPAWASAARIELAPVDAAASRRVLAGQPALGEATVERIVTRARGNPLFLEQLAAHVAESGEEDGLPPALHALIAARLDALSATQRRLIEAAAVEGDVFHLGGLDALVPDIGRLGARWRSSSGASCCCRRSR